MGRRIAFLFTCLFLLLCASEYLFLCYLQQTVIDFSSDWFIPFLLYCLATAFFVRMIYSLLTHFIQKHITLPLQNLSDVSQQMSFMDFKVSPKQYLNPTIMTMQKNLLQLSERMQDNISNLKILNSYVSHEVKNSISIISAKIQLNADKEELLMAIRHIINGIENILALSEVKSEVITETIDLSLISAMVVDDYSKKYPMIELVLEDSVSLVYGKHHLFYCAISNLVDNAIKYGNQKPVTVTVSEKNNTVSVCIEDHGIGISKHQLDKIFEPNYRISSLKKDSYGVGLSLVKNVVEVTGGTIWVDSVLNQGTRFTMVLPSIKS